MFLFFKKLSRSFKLKKSSNVSYVLQQELNFILKNCERCGLNLEIFIHLLNNIGVVMV